MPKFYGEVGYASESVETPEGSGVYENVIIERMCAGDIIRNARSLQSGEQIHDNLTVSNSISIVADAYARDHFFGIQYVKWAGTRWHVTEVEVQAPRLVLRLGEVYNGPTPD